MLLYQQVQKDNETSTTITMNKQGQVVAETYHTPEYTRTRLFAYKDQKLTVSNLLAVKNNETGALEAEQSSLMVYEYNGDSYRVFHYPGTSQNYTLFTSPGFKPVQGNKWHNEQEAVYIEEFVKENNLLVAERRHNLVDNTKSSVTYRYANGVKVEETTTAEDGTVTLVKYLYENGMLQTKITLINQQSSSLFSYVYKDKLLITEDQLSYYNNIGYPAFSKKYYYNTQKEIEKTEHYGRYDGKMHLYKVEQITRKGNTQTNSLSQVENLDWVVGYYDLAALHNWFKSQGMEGVQEIYNSSFVQKNALAKLGSQITVNDKMGNPIELKSMYPDENAQLMGKVVFRNEYNEAGQLDFVISYRVNDNGEKEEMDVKKYYYYHE